jgi:hypothetical protein
LFSRVRKTDICELRDGALERATTLETWWAVEDLNL